MYSTVPGMIGRAAGTACDAGLKTLRIGMTAAAVQRTLGAPDTRGRCWVLKWQPTDAGEGHVHDRSGGASPVDGARVCFSDGQVFKVQTAVHA
jgi:hypothetical protein